MSVCVIMLVIDDVAGIVGAAVPWVLRREQPPTCRQRVPEADLRCWAELVLP